MARMEFIIGAIIVWFGLMFAVHDLRKTNMKIVDAIDRVERAVRDRSTDA